MLHLAPDLELPDNFATEGVAVIGMRGSGKSNTEVRWAEILHAAGIPFVAVDPKGDWGGIRSSADGKKPGLPIPVFGGIAGDFPLEAELGKRIADLLVDENMSAVLDVSLLSKEKRARFLTDFFDQLMVRHQHEPHVRCVIMEEAHRYIPQVIPQGPPSDKGLYARLKEAAAAVLLEGRAWGLGCWAATQRPARLHKDVLEEVGTAVIHRIGVAASNDLRTVAGWVKHEDLGDEIVPTLTKLESGSAWILSPSFGLLLRVKIDRRHTFDSAATPLVGAGSRPLVTMAEINAAAIKEALADAIERAKEDDPVELKKQLKRVEGELAWWMNWRVKLSHDSEMPAVGSPLLGYEWLVSRTDRLPASEPVTEYVMSPDVLAAASELVGGPDLSDLVVELRSAITTLDEAVTSTVERRKRFVDLLYALPVHELSPVAPVTQTVKVNPRVVTARQERIDQVERGRSSRRAAGAEPRPAPVAGDLKLGEGERKVLAVLAQYPDGRTHSELAFLAGYSAKASTLSVFLSKLRKLGLVEPGQPIRATTAGLEMAGGVQELPSGRALLDHWLGHRRMGEGERKVLLALVEMYPDEPTHAELCEATGYSSGASTMSVFLSKLRKLGLVEKGARRINRAFAESIQ